MGRRVVVQGRLRDWTVRRGGCRLEVLRVDPRLKVESGGQDWRVPSAIRNCGTQRRDCGIGTMSGG